jgi:hypothetical protein
MHRTFLHALSTRRPFVLGLGVLVLGATGCALEAGDEFSDGSDGEEIASSEQAFTGINSVIHTATTTTSIPLGTTSGRACFLAGISGRLATMDRVRHGAAITSNGTNYSVTLRTSGGAKIAAGTMCVQPVRGLTSPVSWSSALSASKVVAPITANRRCFLTKIEAIPGDFVGTPPFNNVDDHVAVVQQNGNWVLTGDTRNGNVEAEARCLDISADRSAFTVVGDGGFRSVGLAFSRPGLGACMLTRVKGGFLAQNDAQDGVQIVWNGSNRWFMQVKGFKTGSAWCVE